MAMVNSLINMITPAFSNNMASTEQFALEQ